MPGASTRSSRRPATTPNTPFLAVVFLLSGAAALLFETLWFRLAGLALGNSAQASAAVLSSFMAGLALGNAAAGRFGRDVTQPVRAYALLEICIGVWGAALVLAFPALTRLLPDLSRPLAGLPGLMTAARFAAAFVLFLPPAAAMGATLPLLVKALADRPERFGPALGFLYGVNTLGALCGALLGETLLVAALGLSGTGLFACGLNLLAALLAWRLAPAGPLPAVAPRAAPAAAHKTPAPVGPALPLLAAAFFSGATFLALEVVWFRIIQLFIRGTGLAFAVMLAVVLAGIGLGGLAAGPLTRASDPSGARPAVLAALTGLAVVVSYALFRPLTELGGVGYDVVDWRYAASVSLGLMFLPAVCSGLLFTALGQALYRRLGGRSRGVGLLAMANTLGAMCGPIAAGFVLLPTLGMEKSLFVLTLGYALAAALSLDGPAQLIKSRWLQVSAALFVLGLAFFPFGSMSTHLRRACADFLKDGETLTATFEGVNGTLQYLRKDFLSLPYYSRLVTDGYSMSSTDRSAKRYMKLYAYWPLALHPDPKKALLICFGVGSTAKALADEPRLEHVDVVDISGDVLAHADEIYPDPADNPLKNPKVRRHVEDGRFFLLSGGENYDIITAEPPPPMMAGTVNLYTREFFQLARDRLRQGGMVTYWLPVFELSPAETRSILKAFRDVFPNASLWTGSNFNWMMVGVKEPLGGVSESGFARQWNDPATAGEIRAMGFEKPEQLGALFMMDGEDLAAYIGDAPALTDDRPKLLRGYPLNTAELSRNIAEHNTHMDALASRERFAASPLIAALWPEGLRQRTLPYFEVQQTLNTFLNNFVPPPPAIQGLHFALANTDLSVLPLWLMQSDVAKQRLTETFLALGGPPSAEAHFQLAVGALAGRDYGRAEAEFARAQELGYPSNLGPARLYALCAAGRFADARSLAAALFRPGEGKGYLDWLAQTFGLGR